MNPADVMRLPVGLVHEMNEIIREENREHRRAARAAGRKRAR